MSETRDPSAALVLVADDQPDVRALVAVRLRRSGYRVLECADGVDALAAIRAERPDAAVLDVMMPRMGGHDVLRAMRDDPDPAVAGAFVVLLTAQDRDADMQRGFDIGADDYVAKPFSPRELVARISRRVPPTARAVRD